ncbi:hypothetical protein KORDIASMS9_03216 [Kordia sp. SMS9]|uniref:hypothetical protein n=1 Tax=Kordia sp. SMS9 TaxID=2282170 RepID=UPI000E0D235D|nr:hypothetical protein [Kordia sp. SMS9]AXG70961.1 hypothetical protein KORDIASMS9_03216 [Kordia sp. SMS9]
MKKIAKLLVILLICIASVDLLWFFFPDYISRKYAIVLTIPAITICYFLYVEVKNIMYLLALTAFMVADYYFFIEKNLGIGIISSGVALSIYGVLVLKQSHYISTRKLLISTVPFLTLYMLPFVFFVDRIKDEIFGEVIFYTFAIAYFAFMSTMAFISKRTKVTKTLLLAGLSTAFMGVLFGAFLFVERKPMYSMFANLLFVYSHYKMWQYIIIKDASETVEEV